MLDWLSFLLVKFKPELPLISPPSIKGEHCVQKAPNVALLCLKFHELLLVHRVGGAFERRECNSRFRTRNKLFCHHLQTHRAQYLALERVLLVCYFLHKMLKLPYLNEAAKHSLNRRDASELRYPRGFLFDHGSDVVNSDRRNACQGFALVVGMSQAMGVCITLALDVFYRKYCPPR